MVEIGNGGQQCERSKGKALRFEVVSHCEVVSRMAIVLFSQHSILILTETSVHLELQLPGGFR